ncbi:hypothetical protein AC579_4816 [Pseudocercospora musae]|uniref:F-box domain-containing protein n=1 Tax=Pseudocercospora musae TaxID=113226 RepID=A0A139IIT6_9PEZI|nr:hypothetical protein AC579_4816 [Pseudocercospora musae]
MAACAPEYGIVSMLQRGRTIQDKTAWRRSVLSNIDDQLPPPINFDTSHAQRHSIEPPRLPPFSMPEAMESDTATSWRRSALNPLRKRAVSMRFGEEDWKTTHHRIKHTSRNALMRLVDRIRDHQRSRRERHMHAWREEHTYQYLRARDSVYCHMLYAAGHTAPFTNHLLSKRSSMRTGFFDLPSELRNQIYESAAQDDRAVTRRQRKLIIAGCSAIPAFANTCRGIREEYLAFWIEHRTLEIHLNLPLREPEVEKKLRCWMSTIGRTVIPCCRSFLLGGIRIRLDPDQFEAHQTFNPNMVTVPGAFQTWHSGPFIETETGWREKRLADEIVRILRAKGEKPFLTAEEVESVRVLYREKQVERSKAQKQVKNSKGQFVGWLNKP